MHWLLPARGSHPSVLRSSVALDRACLGSGQRETGSSTLLQQTFASACVALLFVLLDEETLR